MYNYMQPIVATIAAIAMGIGSFGWEKGIAIALVFLGVYIVTQSKSRADLEKEKSLINSTSGVERLTFPYPLMLNVFFKNQNLIII